MFDSIHNKVFSLPAETLVYPGACLFKYVRACVCCILSLVVVVLFGIHRGFGPLTFF